jgi:3-oxoacyl-[acyl-carrier protein] reductase
MLMSVIDGARSAPVHPELAGKRVLVTGVSSECGVDIARAFAEHRTRLILQFAENSEGMQAVAEIAAASALEMQCFGPVGDGGTDGMLKFARTAAKTFNGLDVVINIVSLSPAQCDPSISAEEAEALVAGRLQLPCLLSNIAANRMALCLNEGLILNVATPTAPLTRAARAFAMLTKAALTAMTRRQAQEWADRAIRFNAVAPQTAQATVEPVLSGETDVAAVALYLASSRGRWLSGHVFEAEPAKNAPRLI